MSRFLPLATALLASALTACVTTPNSPSDKDVAVVGVPASVPTLGSSSCVAPHLCKRGESYSYRTGIWGYPDFGPGTLTLMDGSTMAGDIVLLQHQQDWEFVKHLALFKPVGQAEAMYIAPGSVLMMSQVTDDGEKHYDQYGDIYLERLVSGPLRLSFNPAAGTSKAALDFVPASVTDKVLSEVAGREILDGLKDGKSLSDIRNGGSTSQALQEVATAVEITEKEYLMFDAASGKTTAITKANYPKVITAVIKSCGKVEASKASDFKDDFGDIVEAIKYINSRCPG